MCSDKAKGTCYSRGDVRRPVCCLRRGAQCNGLTGAPSTTSGERSVVHMGAAVKGGGEQDGVNEEKSVGGGARGWLLSVQTLTLKDTQVSTHSCLSPDATGFTAQSWRDASGSGGNCEELNGSDPRSRATGHSAEAFGRGKLTVVSISYTGGRCRSWPHRFGTLKYQPRDTQSVSSIHVLYFRHISSWAKPLTLRGNIGLSYQMFTVGFLWFAAMRQLGENRQVIGRVLVINLNWYFVYSAFITQLTLLKLQRDVRWMKMHTVALNRPTAGLIPLVSTATVGLYKTYVCLELLWVLTEKCWLIPSSSLVSTGTWRGFSLLCWEQSNSGFCCLVLQHKLWSDVVKLWSQSGLVWTWTKLFWRLSWSIDWARIVVCNISSLPNTMEVRLLYSMCSIWASFSSFYTWVLSIDFFALEIFPC